LAGYEGNNVQKPIAELAKGSGGLAEFISKFEDDKILYGMCRTTDVYEGTYGRAKSCSRKCSVLCA
jgi:hypothetical protein